ncbi:MAG: hypothetical protein M1136_01130 [Chloroflexi bacterium]|nr:hypothetical protein [Chloroflexota bacterium]
MAVQGNHAYIGLGPRLVVLDVSDPARPAVVGESAPLPGVVQGVAMAGNYAYVAAGSSGLRIIDVSNATSPREVGYYVTAGDARGVVLAGDRAYVANVDGLRIIDVSNATSPREVGYYVTAGYAEGVALASNYAYVAAGSSGLWILRFTAPLTPLTYPVYLPLIQLDR